MVRQYIGARYIPKFVGEWDNTTVYEALSIVEYNNSSYTSKKPVPSGMGNPATATEYWALSGNTSGQIEELDERVTQCEEDIEKLKPLVDKKYVIIGDSYGLLTPKNWINVLINNLGLTSADYVKHALGGSGFLDLGVDTFTDQLNDVASGMTQSEKDAITDVIVCGGANDMWNNPKSDIVNAITTFCNASKTNFTKATIHIGFIGLIATDYDEHNRYKYKSRVVNAYIEGALKNNAKYLNGVEYANLNMNLLTDGIHPNESASVTIGDAITMSLVNGVYTHEQNVLASTTWTDVGSNEKHFTTVFSGENVNVYFNEKIELYSLSFTGSQFNSGMTIGTITDFGYIHPSDYAVGTNCVMQATCDGTVYNIPGMLWINPNGTITISGIFPINDVTKLCTALKIKSTILSFNAMI